MKVEVETKLRELLWYHHGCPVGGLYGDDGEMQCAATKHLPFWIDFRRDSVALIEWKLGNDEFKRLFPMPDCPSRKEKYSEDWEPSRPYHGDS